MTTSKSTDNKNNVFNSLVLVCILLLATVVDSSNGQGTRGGGGRYQPGSSRNKAQVKQTTGCEEGDCYPETGDLLIGRSSARFLEASSTCGLTHPERYCVLGSIRETTKCDACDSQDPYDPIENTNSHLVENIVSRKQSDRFNRWWQSENGKENVSIRFDLETDFAFTHIIMTFKTFRPAAMLIEKSADFGKTWKTYGYFAANCLDSFPGISTYLPKNLGDVYCESKYSLDTPSTKGEVVFKILPPTLIQSRDPYSPEIQDLLKITNLRINFTKLHTFGDNLLDSRNEIKEKYYYSMYEMVVRGSCLCYGHANACDKVHGVEYDKEYNASNGQLPGMVHGKCVCKHHTTGNNCEKCLPLYNDRPWEPARAGRTNECKKCNCNEHADSCHFDEDHFRQSGMTSGGVCDNCRHNTFGINCEHCLDNHWRDPSREITDYDSCKPCTCHPDGSLREGRCDPYTDAEQGLVAGKCHCKYYVDGENCDRCKNGYFNMTAENPDGCEPCSCNLIGTRDNLGCDKDTGLCNCKRFVAGRACDQCLENFFGLSEDDPDGCKPCDCSPGGSIDNECDRESGQCKCKPNMGGRACDQPLNGFYCPTLDHLLYEAEQARKLDDRSADYNKTLHYDEKPRWTGNGYVRVFESSSLEFRIENLHRSGNYEIVVRYENHQNEAWQDVRVTIDRHGQQPDVNDVCAESTGEDDNKAASLPTGVDFAIINPPVCLERGRVYTIKVEFVRFNDNIRNASLNIDSILLVPINNELPTLHSLDDSSSSVGQSQRPREDLLNEFNVYRCKEAQLSVIKDIPEYCEKFICNIGLFHDYAPPCDCDLTGSKSGICEKYGGDCKCKSNVVGRRCENCAPASFGFGPNGCQPCNCDPYGSKNSFCDLESGQCDCYDRIEGKHCDTCFDNYWRFPSCDPCYCNGFADRCNQTDGKCIDCRDHTSGDYCESCDDGYYGKPASGVPCRECMCPGGSSGNQFADTCHLDERYNTFVCECHEGYYGPQCDKCAPHYYGNPLEKGGSCTKCECNGNVDMNDPETCDQQSGECKNCLYNTDGEHCEHCKPGFFGNASNHDCRPCNCHAPGTEGSELNCDEETGQCKCLPNVIGQRCDQCKPDHFGLSSGEGCKDCECDTSGTMNGATYCSMETGQCYCIDSRGGRDCSECSDFYWGDPYQECKRCECNVRGSKSAQCDKHTGCCDCIKGITGCHCDRCARGTTGEVPRCEPCGECFDDWTDVINTVRDDLDSLEQKASNLVVAAGSSTKNFSAEYTLLEQKLSDIKSAIASNRTDRDLKDLNDRVQSIKKQLENKKRAREKYEAVEQWTKQSSLNELDETRRQYQELKEKTESLTRDAMSLKESHESGAIESINKAYKQSEDAANNLATYEAKLTGELSPVLNRLREKIDLSKDNFEESDKMIKGYLSDVMKTLTSSMQNIHGLNEAVCGQLTSDSQKCSAQCGGAVCDGKCGTNTSSCSGMVDSYWKLMNAKSKFDELYNQQELKFKKILTRLRNTSNSLNGANKDIVDLLNYANSSLTDIRAKNQDLTELISNLNNFTKANKEKPDQILNNAVHVQNLELKVTDASLDSILDNIRNLAEQVNIGEVERDTQKSSQESRELKDRVDQLDATLPDLQSQMNKTLSEFNAAKTSLDANEKKLDEIEKKNENVDAELVQSNNSISSIEKMIDNITTSLSQLRSKANVDPDKDKSSYYNARIDSLKAKVKESQYTLEMTRDNLDTLDERLKEVSDRIQKVLQSSSNKNGAEILNKLIELQSNIINKRNGIEEKALKLKKLDSQNDEIRKKISELKNLLSGLKGRAVDIKSDIQSKEKYFNSCS